MIKISKISTKNSTGNPQKKAHQGSLLKRTCEMSAIVDSDDEAPIVSAFTGFEEIQPPKLPGNYSARTKKRWSISSRNSTTSTTSNADATIDGVHNHVSSNHVFPAQLYSTESGRLFHAGKVLIVLVGLPARGKTHLAVSLTRYLRWLGVKSHPFHVSDYRRNTYANFEDDIPQDYFSAAPKTEEGVKLRQAVLNDCLEDVENFFETERGQVAIYDALNVLKSDRAYLQERFLKKNIKLLFIESIVDDDALLKKNVNNASSSPDYTDWEPKKAKADYLKRIKANESIYIHLNADNDEDHLSYIKFINFGERLVTHNSQYGYLVNRIVFFLMNSKIKTSRVFFARCGKSDLDNYVDDEELNSEGLEFSETLASTLLEIIAENKKMERSDSVHTTANSSAVSLPQLSKKNSRQPPTGDGTHEFVVWTATRKRTSASANPFRRRNIAVRERYQLNQLHPGYVADLSEEEIKSKFPEEYAENQKDPYHHRYPRAESYHDLAVRMEPLLLEMERMSGDVLIIAHESSLRVLYGYLMACSTHEIATLQFPRNEIVEISYTPYENKARRITMEGVE